MSLVLGPVLSPLLSPVLSPVLGTSIVDQVLFRSTIQAITPILLAALGGLLCQRVGVFNIALEGTMLAGAFGAVVGSWYLHSGWAGVVVGALVAMSVAGVLALGSVTLGGDPIVSGIGLNLLATGATAYLLRQIFKQQGVFQDPRLRGLSRLSIPGLRSVPVIGPVLDQQTALTYGAWLLVVVVAVVLFRTPLGLRLRGVGEEPDAATTLGVPVGRYQVVTVVVAGALCGLAGAQLSLGSVTLFAEGMSAGRGWIAVVAVMLGRAHPAGVAGACALFGLADAIGLRLQGRGWPNQLTDVAPYVITLIALVAVRARRRTGPALGVST